MKSLSMKSRLVSLAIVDTQVGRRKRKKKRKEGGELRSYSYLSLACEETAEVLAH